jgi:hypothetical protein
MEESQRKFVLQCERYETDLKKRWSEKVRVIRAKGVVAKEVKEALYKETLEKNKQAVEKERAAFEERYQALLQSEVLDREGRRVERDERAQNAKHLLASAEYAGKLKAKQMKEDMSAATKLEEEVEKVKEMKTGARIRFSQARKRLENEFNEIENLDPAQLAGVKKVLQLNDVQFAELMAMARMTAGEVPPQKRLALDSE